MLFNLFSPLFVYRFSLSLLIRFLGLVTSRPRAIRLYEYGYGYYKVPHAEAPCFDSLGCMNNDETCVES